MIGDEIKKARARAKLSQEELAFRAGVHRTYISILERNKKSPTLDVLLRICSALGVSPSSMVKKIESS